MPNIPAELVEDILRRLPVKTLKRFRAVGKSWCSLIDSENFIKLHFRQSLISNSNRNLIFGGLGVYSVELDALDKAQVIKPPFYYKSVDGISNSCNGIVIVMSDPPVMWNPFSREYKGLPECSTEYPTQQGSYSKTIFGFGYDSMNDDYKVVRIVEFRDERSHVWIGSETKIYGLKSNSWRKIEGFPYPLPFLKGHWRVHVNSSLHTPVEDPYEMDTARIMAFSLETEKHYQLMFPEGIRIRGVEVSLDVIGECLALVLTYRSRVSVWVMKEYGVRESWMKLLTLSPPAIERSYFVKPVAYSRDGDKVLLNCDDKKLIWYDLRTKTVEEVIVEGLPFFAVMHHLRDKVDLVTETDKKCEELIFDLLKQQFPDHKFIGEETTAACGTTELTNEPTWIVDPLDGTTNFVHGFPFVCVSIGLTIERIPIVGVVFNPIMDELFTAIRGKGAFLNGKPIKTSSQSELVKSLLATEVGTKRDKSTVDATTDRINKLLFKVRSLRMSGSCALNLCGIACGRLDLFYELGFGGPWDVAAGAVIVSEAGGLVFDISGKDFDITSQRIAASNPHLKDAFVEALQHSD